MRKYVTEFIGTFFLVLTIGTCVIAPDIGGFAPLAIGLVLVVVVFAGGHISGAHYNPAVTLGVWLRGRCTNAEIPGYVLAQLAGSVAGAMLALYLKGNPDLTPTEFRIGPALIAEFFGAFLLVFVVLNVATCKGTSNNSYYGLAIGFTLASMIYALGPISGGAFNPAVAVGLTLMQVVKGTQLWIYLLANFAGGAVASLVFRYLHPDDR